MTFQELKEDKLNQVRALIRVQNDDILALNSARCLALIFLADYYQVFFAFKHKRWNDCGMHSIARKLARYEPLFMDKKNKDLVDALEMIMLDRCSYAHGDVILKDVEIDLDEINKFTDILDSLITKDIYDNIISLDVKNIP